MNNPFESGLVLKRYPVRKGETLQAWDSADELILHHLNQGPLSLKNQASPRILLINDRFGSLACALNDFNVSSYTDSYVSFRSAQMNSENRMSPLSSLEELSGNYDIVLIQVPKNMSYFEDILCHLTSHLHSESQLVCGYMIKHQAKASFELLEKYIGKTKTSLAQKKARLIFASFEKSKICASPFPLSIHLDGFEKAFINHSNVFSREKLDIGTRFLLSHIPHGDYQTILDLGCGNGVLGIAAKQANPKAQIVFTDESKMATQSAEANYNNYFTDSARFLWTYCYENQEVQPVDLVLCNPPFHQGNTLGDYIAQQMFKDAHRALKPGGTLRVIGNNHLQYHQILKRIFGNSKIIATNNKFMIVDAVA